MSARPAVVWCNRNRFTFADCVHLWLDSILYPMLDTETVLAIKSTITFMDV